MAGPNNECMFMPNLENKKLRNNLFDVVMLALVCLVGVLFVGTVIMGIVLCTKAGKSANTREKVKTNE